jgi:hypothetical protein
VHLSDGSRFAGRIVEEECTDQLLVIRHLRTRAKKSIPWTDVESKQARQLRIQLGFEVAEAKAGMSIQGHEIRNRAGNLFIGMLLNAKSAQREGEYKLKTAEGILRIRIADVREGPTPVQVDALAVFTPQEIYEKKLAEKEPETAEDHFRLGEFARSMGALERAKVHYEKVIELEDPKYPASLVQRLLDRVNKRIGAKEAEDSLREIKKAIVYNHFQRALERMEAFRAQYGDDEFLMKELAELEDGFKERRTDYFVSQVSKQMRDRIKDLLGDKVKEPELTIRQLIQYAAGDPGDDKSASHGAVAEIAEKLGIEPQEVLTFWNQRPKRTIQKAFFRDGTFIVVENLQDAMARAPKPRSSGRGQKAIKPPKPHPIMTPDAWFKAKVSSRKFADLRDWAYAFWAERGGMTEVLEPKMENCAVCAGKGYTVAMHTSPAGTVPFYDRCQNCHMAKGFRVVRFR